MREEGRDRERVGGNTQTHSTRARARTLARRKERRRRRDRVTCVALCAGSRGSEPALPMIHAVGEPVVRGRVFTLTWPFIAFYTRPARANVEGGRERDDATRKIDHRTNETPQDCAKRVLDESSIRATRSPQPTRTYCGDHA